MSSSSALRTLLVLASVVATAGCPVFPVSVVPAKEALPPPAGKGWSCYQYEQTTSSVASQAGVKTACFRDADACNRNRASQSKAPGTGQVGFCQPADSVACTYQFGGGGAYGCYLSMQECQTHVGGVGMLPGVKQSECSTYE